MNTIETTVQELFNGQSAHQSDPEAIALAVLKTYRFLPAPVSVEIEDRCVRLRFPSPSPADQARAEKLAAKAACHAEDGRCRQAIRLWLQAVALAPTKIELWRNLGMASSELRHNEAAQNYLRTALLIDPHDASTLVVLARLAFEGEKDAAKAEGLARRALAVAPEDPWALNCLGVLFSRTGRDAEAMSLFTAAVQARPEFAPPYLSLAYLEQQRGRTEAALRWLQQLFACALPQDIRCRPVFQKAMQMMQSLEHTIACRN